MHYIKVKIKISKKKKKSDTFSVKTWFISSILIKSSTRIEMSILTGMFVLFSSSKLNKFFLSKKIKNKLCFLKYYLKKNIIIEQKVCAMIKKKKISNPNFFGTWQHRPWYFRLSILWNEIVKVCNIQGLRHQVTKAYGLEKSYNNHCTSFLTINLKGATVFL